MSCGGVAVATGDLIVGDEDGVVAVPWEDRERVLLEARAVVAREDDLMRRVSAGVSSASYLGLIDQ